MVERNPETIATLILPPSLLCEDLQSRKNLTKKSGTTSQRLRRLGGGAGRQAAAPGRPPGAVLAARRPNGEY